MSLLGQLTVGILGNMGGLSGTFRTAENEVRAFGKRIEGVGRDLSTIGGTLTKSFTLPLVAVGGFALKSAIEFESGFAGIRKTVNMTEEEFAKLKDGILDMSKKIPVAATVLTGIGESAGQLGIHNDKILEFTRVMADLSVATNMGSEEAATNLARFANIVGMSQDNFGKLGATIVDLGNNFATTESEIVDMAMRLAGAGSQVGMSEANILALSTALTSVGIASEMGGSAMSKVMTNMQLATTTGFDKVNDLSAKTGYSLRELQMMASHSGQAFGNLAEDLGMTKKEMKNLVNAGVDLQGFANIAGMTGAEFKQAFETDAMGAMASFINGLGNAEEVGESAINMLQEMGITEVRLRDSLLRSGGASELVADSIRIANEAWGDGTALQKEAAERYGTTASKLQMFKNEIDAIGIMLGDTLIPALLHMLDVLDPIVQYVAGLAETFAALDPSVQGNAIAFAAFLAAIGPILAGIGFMVTNIGALVGAFGGLAGGVAGAGGILGALTGPVGLTVLAVAGLVAVFATLWQTSETFRNSIITIFETVKTAVVTAFGIVADFLGEKIAFIKQFWDENGSQFLVAVENVFNFILKIVQFVMPAVLFIVDMVWTAVKQIIEGAINVIMGLMKIFTGLFTGDFSKMWEGVKQIFWGAIDLIIGFMTVTFVGGLRALFANLLKGSIGIFKSLGSGIVNVFKGFATTGKNLASGLVNTVVRYFQNFLVSVRTIFTLIRSTGATVWTSIRTTIVEIVKTMWELVLTRFRNMVTGVKNIFSTVKKVITDIWKTVMDFFKGIDLLKVGQDIIKGLVNGIGSMASAVWDKAKEVAKGIGDGIKKVLGIKSPSTEMYEVGQDTGTGLALGIASTTAENEQVMKEIGKILIDVVEKNAGDIKLIADEAEKERIAIQEESAKKRQEIERKSSQSIQSIMSNSKKKTRTKDNQRILNHRADLAAKLTKIADDEKKKLEKINDKASKDILKAESDEYKLRLAAIKQFVDDRKSTEELTALAEIEIWKMATKEFKAGTKERITAQKEYQKALKTINDDIAKTNGDFAKKMQDVSDKLTKAEEDANNEYAKAFDDRRKSLVSFAGLFDEFNIEVKTTGEELLLNLSNQVDGFQQWQAEIGKLSMRHVNDDLLAELREMGPKALPELIALNSLTDDQLSKYSALYQQKTALARIQAEEELAGMKDDTKKQIEGMREAANEELEAFREEWIKQIQSITKTTEDELMGLEGIGKQAGQGLLDGLSSMEGALMNKATDIANSIKNAMKKALEIKSPSRVMFGLGENTGEGFLLGMGSKVRAIAAMATNLATSAIPTPKAMDFPSFNQGLFEGGADAVINADTHNYDGLFRGAEFHVREETDIKKIARELFVLQRQTARGRGRM